MEDDVLPCKMNVEVPMLISQWQWRQSLGLQSPNQFLKELKKLFCDEREKEKSVVADARRPGRF